MLFLTKDFNRANHAFTILENNQLLKKRDFFYYTDKESNSNIFGLVLPSYTKNTQEGYYGHIHCDSELDAFNGIRKSNKDPMDCGDPVAMLIAFYFDQYADQLSDFVQDVISNGPITSETIQSIKVITEDFTYLLQKYAEYSTVFPDIKEFFKNIDTDISLQTMHKLAKSGDILPEDWAKIKQYGNFYAICFGNLLPLLTTSNDLKLISHSLLNTTLPEVKVPTNKYGFAKINLAKMQEPVNTK